MADSADNPVSNPPDSPRSNSTTSSTDSDSSTHKSLHVSAELGRSAGLLSLGNIAGRILGLAREIVIATYFGSSGQVSAFHIASQVPTLLYDLFAGGMLSAAVVPTLSEYIVDNKKSDFVRVAGTLISLFALILAVLVIFLELLAPQVVRLLAAGFEDHHPELLILTTHLLRIILPTVWLISLAGVVTGILYACQRFTVPAMGAAIFNSGIILAVPLLSSTIGVSSLAVGILLGSSAQLAAMGWDLRRYLRQTQHRLPFTIVWRHPALRKIVYLYLPIAGVTLLSTAQVALDRRLASGTGEQSIAWMRYATTLQQLPLGLTSIAIALASLPSLSRYFAEGDTESYRRTLGSVIRLVTVLIAPAAVGLWLLGDSIIKLIFEHGAFERADTVQVMLALHIYTIGMIFAAIDFPLNYAFYARNDTRLPAVAGVLSIVVYCIVAFSMVNGLGYLGLVWADTIKHGSHLLVVGVVLWMRIGGLTSNLGRCFAQVLAASIGMTGIIWMCRFWLSGVTADPTSQRQLTDGLWDNLWLLVIGGSSGLVAYVSMLYLLRNNEIRWIFTVAHVHRFSFGIASPSKK